MADKVHKQGEHILQHGYISHKFPLQVYFVSQYLHPAIPTFARSRLENCY